MLIFLVFNLQLLLQLASCTEGECFPQNSTLLFSYKRTACDLAGPPYCDVIKQNCNCLQKFHPVCGTDANTYDNLCFLQYFQLAYNGSCCPQLTCLLDRNPVCDNFGRTHHNECFLNRAKCLARRFAKNLLIKVHDGECTAQEQQQENCSDICTFPGRPVCDHLGQTHENECSLEQTNCNMRSEKKEEYILVSYGVCNTSRFLDKEQMLFETVLNTTMDANFSISLGNVSTVESPNLKLVNMTASTNATSISLSLIPLPEIMQLCSAADCDKSWNPVCDANNKTHRNLCLFKFYACKVNRVDGSLVVLAHEGECTSYMGPRSCRNCVNEEDKLPICDNMNQTHASLCDVSRFNCFQRLDHRPERVLVHLGHCTTKSSTFTLKQEVCPKTCASDWKPVCDEAGVTHPNLCSFQRSNCIVRQAGRQAPMLKHINACGKNDELVELKTEATIELIIGVLLFECPLPLCAEDSSSPVCDSQGKYHENICMFTYARCISAQKGEFLTIDQDEKCMQEKCNEKCENNTKLICGSDLNTYQNHCYFLKEKCIDKTLEILFYGSCAECLPSPCPPLSSNAPDTAFVCDSEDVTRSLCEYQMLSCIGEKTPSWNFTILHLGRCCGSSESCLNKSEDLLCGKDGRTYRNQCELDLENCRNEKLLVATTDIDHKGECTSGEKPEQEGTFHLEEDFQFYDAKNNTEQCKASCGNLYAPVCGVDDLTYTNICFLKLSNCKLQKNVTVAYEGECCELKCPSNFDPVCDNENTTHQNLCFFGQQRCIAEKVLHKNITISKFDVCTNDCTMVCTKEYNPICGNNAVTYVNVCEMEKQNCYIEKNITSGVRITKDYDGECCPELNCGFEFEPVCDSEDNTYSNECIFRQSQCVQLRRGLVNLTLKYNGACCNQPCENDYNPVCDGNLTYENACRFRIAQCEAERKGEMLSLAYSGECCIQPTGLCKASGTICDSYGQTHGNLCQFEYKKCLLERATKKTLSIAHRGECCSIEPCHKGDQPVCDTHGKTHASLCHFQNTQCIHNKIHRHTPIHFAYNGSCCSSSCRNEWEPVCDQHGAIYKNKCWFLRKACEQSKRSKGLLLETPCTERRIRSLVKKGN